MKKNYGVLLSSKFETGRMRENMNEVLIFSYDTVKIQIF
jgi:hypothetical protein